MDPPARVYAVSARHQHVHDDEVRDHLLRHPLRLLPVARVSHHLELAGPLQQLLETVPHDRVIIHQQDSDPC